MKFLDFEGEIFYVHVYLNRRFRNVGQKGIE